MTARRTRHRACPDCGETRGSDEVASRPAGETLPMDELRRFWAGLNRTKVFFTYRRCDGCGLLYCPEYFTPDALAALYANLEPNMDIVPSAMLEQTQRGYYDAVAAAGPPAGDYLEIGPDVGYMVGEAAARGDFARYWLFEPNRAVHYRLGQVVGTKPATITREMHDLSAVPDGAVGLAVMVHVLDHLIDPLAMVRQIARKLLPGGLLAVVTHNEGSLLRRVLGTRFPPFCLQHPQLFRPASMRHLLEGAGLVAVEVTGSANTFPTDFLIRQSAQAAGLDLSSLPLPAIPVRLRLGNILTLARAPGQAAADTGSRAAVSAS